MNKREKLDIKRQAFETATLCLESMQKVKDLAEEDYLEEKGIPDDAVEDEIHTETPQEDPALTRIQEQ